MKLAPITVGVALLLLLFGIAVSKPTTPDRKVLPLDFSGIDTLQVIGGNDQITIEIRDGAPAQLSFDDFRKNLVTVGREGSTLTIRPVVLDYSSLEITVPAFMGTFVVDGATIKSRSALDEVTVRASNSISWQGNVRQLQIEAVPPNSKCKQACGLDVSIGEGSVANLQVRAAGGKVTFYNPDAVGSADLYLGPRGKVSINGATRLGNFVLHDSAPP